MPKTNIVKCTMNNFRYGIVVWLFMLNVKATTFELLFDNKKNLKFEYSIYEVDREKFKEKIGIFGDLFAIEQLENPTAIPNFKFDLKTGDSKILALVVENKSDRTINFYVSPHESNPADTTLDFKFNCLCYNHIYKIKPKSKWFRIMKLHQTKEITPSRKVKLRHHVIEKI